MKNLVGFIGRFQPFHLGNVDAVRQILEREGEDTKIIFGIGSAEEELTTKNPFSFFEREAMIRLVMAENFPKISYEIFPIPDFYDAEKWVQYILDELPKMKKIYSGNIYTLQSFENFSGENSVIPSLEKLDLRVMIKGSHVRKRLLKNQDISELAPKTVIRYLKEISASKRLCYIECEYNASFWKKLSKFFIN
jgi:nicotinamide-nucleotide adenylyltransferase